MHLDEHENLTFRERHGRVLKRPATRSSTGPWLVVAVIAAIIFVFVMRALMERTAWTAGASPTAENNQSTPVEPPRQDYVDESAFHQKHVPSVYRCVDRAGGVSFQSQPCGPGQRTTKVVAAPPEPEPNRPRQTLRRVSSNQSGYSTYQLPREDPLVQRKVACAVARQSRDSTLRQVGLRRTYDLLQRLDSMVNNACNGL